MDVDNPLLEVSNLEVKYGNLIGLRQLDLAVKQGEIFVLLGSNGAGKSSALNSIAGVVPSSRGQIRFKGRDITRMPAWRTARSGLVLVPEGRQIVGPLTVEENLKLGIFANQDKKAEGLVERVYETFPVLAEFRKTPGGLLSGGQQQMLAFGRALMSNPQMILLDEPSMGLAPVMVDRVLDAVQRIATQGIGIVMVEQNSSALEIADAVAVLEQGSVVVRGTPEAIHDDERIVQAYLGGGASADSR